MTSHLFIAARYLPQLMALPGEPILPLPTPPDFIICDPVYGYNLPVLGCLLAAHTHLPTGSSPVQWLLTGSIDSPYRLPFQITYSGCTISVDIIHKRNWRNPRNTLTGVSVIPDDVRSLAARVIQQCVTLRRGMGGFGTLGIRTLTDYAAQGWTPYNRYSFPETIYFLTVSARSSRSSGLHPGRTDPAIPLALAQAAVSANRPGRRDGLSATQVWMNQAEMMTRGGVNPWYKQIFPITTTTHMTYQCDANLGAPSVVDCTQLEWSQLPPASDTLAVGPGLTTFLHSNTCYLAISAAVSIILTWAQIRIALSTLINMCVEAPYQNPRGGRAYSSSSWQTTSGRNQRRQSAGVTGLNALPPEVNVTVFEQREGAMDSSAAAELASCTWEAVSKGICVSTCP
ncbi:hypothetical protein MMC12_001639 [Toensbergia leucococca]|nr:hypothetical protein [Toensbergia leucococca]